MFPSSSASRWGGLSEKSGLSADLEQWITEILLLGKTEDFEALMAVLNTCDDFPAELKSGIESLYHFRTYYADTERGLTDDEQARVMKMDADWTMQLLHSIQELREERLYKEG